MNKENKVNILSYIAYPLTLSLSVYGFFILRIYGAHLFVACYLPPSIAAAFIIYLEKRLPYRRDWTPNRREVVNDLEFMLIVQILLPIFLSFFVVYLVITHFPVQQQFLSALWPHSLPILVQAILMLLIVDFFRYWLHRANHNFKPLWRLHAVHHSPPKLYWINTGRFHPIEKAFQFLCDSFPFILAGVQQEVLGLYFLIYSTNGFFQHCNVDLRLGLLNYIISGPELHRWHHSKLVEESNNNYGSSLIIWDIMFGSYLNPQSREVGDLGLLAREYPSGFISQLKAPFDHAALESSVKREK